MLELNFTIDEMRKIVGQKYYSFSKIKEAKGDKKRKMVISNKTLRLRGLYEIYRRLAQNPCYIALILNDLAEDETDMFCKDERIAKEFDECHRVRHRDDYYWILESYEEGWKGEKRIVYRAKEMWRKFRVLLDALCEFHKLGKEIEKDLSIIREVIIDVFDKEVDENGKFTDRMVIFALENLEWLHSKGIKKPKSTFLWGMIALIHLPREGLRFRQIVFDVWDESIQNENLLYTLVFARTLAEFGRNLFESEDYKRDVFKRLDEKISNVDGYDSVLFWKIWTYSSLAKGLHEYGFVEDVYYCLKKAEKELKKMRNDKLKNLAEIVFLIDRAVIIGWYNTEEALTILNQCLSSLEGLEFENSIEDVFKLSGGRAEEIFKDHLKEWRRHIYYELGLANYYIDLNESERFFRESLKLSERIDHKLALLRRIGRINVLRSFEFGFEFDGKRWDFERLWKICEENLPEIPNVHVSHICVEYLVQSILKGEFKRREDLLDYLDYLELYSPVKTLFYGLSCVLGCKLKELNEVVEMLRDLDLSGFPEPHDLEEVVKVDEIKIEVEEMYNCYLKGDRLYETYKKLVWDKTYSTHQTLARILFFYITGDLETAMKLAKLDSKKVPKVPNKILEELSEAIGKELKAKSDYEREKAREEVKKAFVKLFYFHI